MTNIALIGEAYGEVEERERTPFVGPTGYELTKLLGEAGITRADCFLTNVFNLRPRGNRIEALCGGKDDAIPGYPTLIKGKYVRAEFAHELDRLGDEILTVNPNLIVALGNTAMWALLGKTFISKLRGTTTLSTHTVEGFKVLPTYHPAAIFRQWELRPTTVMDLMKAAREAEFPEIRRPKREIWIEPSLGDIERFYNEHIRGSPLLSVDIETAGTQITCVGFATSSERAIVIPFLDPSGMGRSYWPNIKDECAAWGIIKRILGDGSIKKLFQNGLYDISFLYRGYGIKVRGAEHDTMLLHHALQPESLKGLGFLGSVYTDEGNWKQMRGKASTIKADE